MTGYCKRHKKLYLVSHGISQIKDLGKIKGECPMCKITKGEKENE